jgi:hypothetical protein
LSTCSASKLTAADGSKKTFCTKLNFPSEPAHKIWLALKEKNPAEHQPQYDHTSLHVSSLPLPPSRIVL